MTPDSGFQIPVCSEGPIWNLKSGIYNLLCITQTSGQIPLDDEWLSGEERKIFARFHVPKRRMDWRLGRWTAKRAVCAFQQMEADILPDLEIRAAADGAPEAWFRGEPAAVSISLSHSRDRGLCIAGPLGLDVGCDLEWIEPREETFAADYFTPEELSSVLQAPVKRELAETLIWSAKETTLKILRKGLSRDTRSVRIRADFAGGEESWRSWTGQCMETTRIFSGLWRSSAGFIYTIACA